MNGKVWRLALLPGKRWMALIPHDLEYFNEHFVGEPLPERWRAPPYQVTGVRKKVPDFMSWMSGTPLVKERVAQAIAALPGSRVQTPFFDTIKGEKVFALNVLSLVADALDVGKSEVLGSDVDGEILSVRTAVFANGARKLPPIFKLAETPDGEIYVTRTFCEMVVRERFTGVGFADPAIDPLFQAIRGMKVNTFPGIEEE